MMAVVSEITRIEEFTSLRGEWNELLEKSASNTVFLTWEWLHTWWEVFGREGSLRILVVREKNSLKAIAPLFEKGLWGLRSLQFIGSYGVGSDYLDFILFPGQEERLLEEMLRYLKSHGDRWDFLCLSDVPQRAASLETIRRQAGIRAVVRSHTSCPYLQLPATWGELNRALSPSMRTDLKRKKKRLEDETNHRFGTIAGREELEKAWETFIALNAKRMKEKSVTAPFSDDRFRDFHARVVHLLSEKDMVRLFSLEVGVPVGYIYNIKYGNKYLFYQIGFDSEWGRLSPGTQLFRYSLEQAIAEGVCEFDFLQGEEDYKYRWTKDVRVNVRIYVFGTSARHIATWLLVSGVLLAKECRRRIKQAANTLVGSRLLGRTGLGSSQSGDDRSHPR